MARVYFPSCKLKATFPHTAAAAAQYMKDEQGAVIADCCRGEEVTAQQSDLAVYNCNTCGIIIDEWVNPGSLESIYEVLLADDAFEFPSYDGKTMAVQDCWRANDKPKVLDAIRGLAAKMGIETVELEENKASSTYCGDFLMQPAPPYYADYAPKRFGAELPEGIFEEQPEEARKAYLQAHAATIPTNEVICNCLGCYMGLATSGKKASHILELIFGTER